MKRVLLAFLLLSLAAASAQQPAAAPSGPKKPITIEAIFAEGGITGRGPETVKWSPDGTKVSFVQRDDSGEHGALYYVDVASGKSAVLVAEEKLANLQPSPDKAVKDEREKERRARYSVAGYHWAPDSKHILFDSAGQLWLYSLESGTAVVVGSGDDPKFSPDGTRVAYIKHHNVFVRDLKNNKEKALTKDSDENFLNGEVDWVYAEELDVRSNYFWSPDSKRIVFLRMDETKVPTYPITDWIPTHPSVDQQKYPKAGDPNPAVRVGVVDSDGGKVKWFDLPAGTEYVPRFGWLTPACGFHLPPNFGNPCPDLIWFQTLNREQNKLELYFAEQSGKMRMMLREESPDAWVEINDDFKPFSFGAKDMSSSYFTWSSWRDGHNHIYLYYFDSTGEAKLDRQVTHGDFETFGIQTQPRTTLDTIYFVADEGDDRQRHLYSVKLDGTGMQRVTQDKGTHSPSFAPDGKHYVDNYSALMTPPRLSVCAVGGTCAKFWEARSVADFNLITPEFVDFKAEDGTVLHGTLLVNPVLSKSSAVLMNPYGGPSGQVSRDVWGGSTFLFHQILAREGIAVLQVDNRGMGNRGKKFAAALKHNFGEIEFKDQLTALDQALAKFPFLDRTRLGWWGWSYGGYMTLYAMTHSDRFRAGVSVAPVTDWRDYDSIYTERYMDVPAKNAEGYKKSSPVNFAGSLSGSLLEVHGTGDDNVHMQNTIQMTNAFIAAGKQFRLMVYPRKTHGISGTPARTHLFHMIQNHLLKELVHPPAQCQ